MSITCGPSYTLTGTNHYHGQDFLKKGMWIRLEKEPDNRHDREAIKVLMDGIGHIGYVANSPWTVIGESFSAGRLYDKIFRHFPVFSYLGKIHCCIFPF